MRGTDRERERVSEFGFFLLLLLFLATDFFFPIFSPATLVLSISREKKPSEQTTTHRMHPPERDPRGPDPRSVDVEQLLLLLLSPLLVAAPAVASFSFSSFSRRRRRSGLGPLLLLNIRSDKKQPVQDALQVPAVVDQKGALLGAAAPVRAHELALVEGKVCRNRRVRICRRRRRIRRRRCRRRRQSIRRRGLPQPAPRPEIPKFRGQRHVPSLRGPEQPRPGLGPGAGGRVQQEERRVGGRG